MSDTATTNESEQPSNGATWLQLIRLPNQFTIPGDVLAGAALIGALKHPDWPHLTLTIFISFCLYSAGLLFNDWFDRNIDAVERPLRPIPSGAVKASQVLAAGVFLILLAIGLGAMVSATTMLMAGILAVLVIVYNSFATMNKLEPYLDLWYLMFAKTCIYMNW